MRRAASHLRLQRSQLQAEIGDAGDRGPDRREFCLAEEPGSLGLLGHGYDPAGLRIMMIDVADEIGLPAGTQTFRGWDRVAHSLIHNPGSNSDFDLRMTAAVESADPGF
jgi:hypothetical protein